MIERWSVERAQAWGNRQPWFFGANFIPSTAINQLEMWQKDTFDPETIERELGYAQGIGMNIMRVYLHDLLWEHDRDGFIDRLERYLTIADEKKGSRPCSSYSTIFGMVSSLLDRSLILCPTPITPAGSSRPDAASR